PQFPAAYQKFSGESLPWSPSPQNSNTQQVLKNFDGNIAQWRQINHLPNGANLSLALNIYSWFIQRGIKADPNAPEQNFDEAIISSKAHCSNFFKDLYALYSREGFSPHSEFVKVDQKGVEVQHIVTAIEMGGKTYLVDPYYRSFNAAHMQHTPM